MTTKKTGRPGRGRVPNDPLDWVEGVGQANSEENAIVTHSVEGEQEKLSAAPVQTQTLIERKQEKTMSETKNIEQSGRCEAIGEIRRVAEAVRNGNLEVRADVSEMKGECAEVAEAVNEMLAQILQQQQQQQQHYISVLASLSTCVQLADENYNIIYMNESLQKMFADNEHEIRKTLPSFDKNKLIGMNMDAFHKSPSHQRKILEGLKSSVQASIKLGGSSFSLTATPLFKADGRSAGTVVEWVDITVWDNLTDTLTAVATGDLSTQLIEELRCDGAARILRNTTETVRNNLRALVADTNMLSQAAVDGKLATRADESKHQGDFRKIVEGVNETLDAVIGPLNNISVVIEALGNNDLSTSLEGEYKGDFLRIIDAFDNALVRMSEAFYQITDATEQVSQSAESLNASSQNMAANSEEQSSSVEEVTSSLEETDSQVKANTDNANAANQLVMDTSQAANQGQVKMTGMIGAMDAINQSSQDIAKIIKVIDEIAFQTNLLALNAAVEAARAGQYGRGFAVVAQEVRNLAGRSAKAARETADLIEDSSKRVREGVGIANETREALDQIVGNVTKVKDLVAEIAAASTEQSSGVSQINVAMSQVAKAAQEGSQQAEELASASGELTNVTDQMRMEISRFKLRERQQQASGLGLEGVSPDIIRQIMALLAAQQSGSVVAAAQPVVQNTEPRSPRSKSPKAVLPLDADERGFGGF